MPELKQNHEDTDQTMPEDDDADEHHNKDEYKEGNRRTWR